MAGTISIRFEDKFDSKLTELSRVTKRPKSFFVKEAVEKYLEEMEDIYVSLDRIANPSSTYISTETLLSNLENKKIENSIEDDHSNNKNK